VTKLRWWDEEAVKLAREWYKIITSNGKKSKKYKMEYSEKKIKVAKKRLEYSMR
jgi:hypothetical protein